MHILVLELALSFWMELHVLVVKLCSHLVAVLPVSTAIVDTTMMLVSDAKVHVYRLERSLYCKVTKLFPVLETS